MHRILRTVARPRCLVPCQVIPWEHPFVPLRTALPPISSGLSKTLFTSGFKFQEKTESGNEEATQETEELEDEKEEFKRRSFLNEEKRDPKDRSRVIPVELSIKYMESAAYKETYGDYKVWELYRRNFSKGRSQRDTRATCILNDRIETGSPCPICRDEYLVIDYRNLKLLNQFITDYNGQTLTSKKTGVCQAQWLKIRVELEKAKDRGYLRVDPPFVKYDYEKYK